jgi:PAS domain S-box-containing protein
MPDVLRDAVILSVHDDPAGREAARRALQRVGCTVLEATNGPGALAIAARQPVDLILLDVDLPGMDGYEVVRRLKADPATAAIPVLYLSATPVDPDSVIRGLEGGADGYLTEPASPEVLISTVRALLRMRRATQEAEQLAQQRQEALARLQSTYEELETANEELAAANEELRISYDEIEQQRAFFAAVLRQVPVGIIIGQDPSGEVVTTNEAGQAIYEVAPGENLSAFAPPGQRPRHRYYQEGRELRGDELPMRQALVQDRVVHDVEIEMWSASGRRRWLLVNAAPVHDGEGRIIGSVGVTWDITEQRRAQEALRESEERYRRLHDTMLQGVVYQAADGTILSMNPAAVQILGKTPEEFLGETSVSVEHDTVREDGTLFPGVEHPAMVALRTGAPVQGVVMGVYNPRRKERRWISIDAIPMFREGEARPHQVYTIFADITERRQAEGALRRQAGLLDLSYEAIFAWELDGPIVSWNRGAERLYGYTPQEAVGRISHELLHTVHPQGREKLLATLAQEKEWTGDVVHTTKDGRTLAVETRHQVVEEQPGRWIVLETNRDVSGRRQAEEERERLLADAERQRSFLAAFLDNAPVAMAYLDTDLRFLRVNRMYAEWLELPAEQFVGRTHAEIWGPQKRTETMRQVLARGEPVWYPEMPMTYPVRMHRPAGYVDFAVFPVKNERGEVVGLALADQEVTERVQRREQLLAAERARAALAEGLNREIAHRTKNNLAMAAGLLQLQMHQQRDARVRTALSATMSRLMAFASIQEELQAVTAAGWVDLLPVLERVSAASAGAFAGGEAVVSVSGARAPLPSKAATNLAVVTNELVTNALKHGAAGPDGKLHVDVVIAPADDSLRLRVWNSGNPIPPDLDPTASRGLGLQLVRDLIVVQYHGAFHLRAERGGSLAEVTVPRAGLQQE